MQEYINKDFKWCEFIRPDDNPNQEILDNIKRVAYVLSIYKHKLFDGHPVTITSGYRNPEHNKSIGGATNSYHCKGLAVDFVVEGFTIAQLYRLMDVHHFGGVEDTQGNWQHVDLRGNICRFRSNNRILTPHYSAEAHDRIFKA